MKAGARRRPWLCHISTLGLHLFIFLAVYTHTNMHTLFLDNQNFWFSA